MQKFETLELQLNEQKTIGNLFLNREKQLNTFNLQFFDELDMILNEIDKIQELRVLILSGKGKLFSSGLDLKDAINITNPDSGSNDTSRKGIFIHDQIVVKWQNTITKMEKLKIPVISSIHKFCIGGAIDLILASDIRYCTKDCQFSIKEVDIGICADLGTIQRLTMISKNISLMKELAYSGNMFDSQTALDLGLISRVFQDQQQLNKAVDDLANLIASKTPVAIYTLKKVINYQYKELVQRGLEYVAALNMNMLQTEDIAIAVQSFFDKKKPVFSKL